MVDEKSNDSICFKVFFSVELKIVPKSRQKQSRVKFVYKDSCSHRSLPSTYCHPVMLYGVIETFHRGPQRMTQSVRSTSRAYYPPALTGTQFQLSETTQRYHFAILPAFCCPEIDHAKPQAWNNPGVSCAQAAKVSWITIQLAQWGFIATI